MLRSRIALLALVLIVGLTGSYCSTGGTVEKATLRASVSTLDAVYLADASATLAAKVFDANCPKNTLFSVEQCVGWRHFANGRAPADPICQAPTFITLKDVYLKCGFARAFPTVIRAYQDHKETVTSIAEAVDLMIGGAKAQAQTAAAGGR